MQLGGYTSSTVALSAPVSAVTAGRVPSVIANRYVGAWVVSTTIAEYSTGVAPVVKVNYTGVPTVAEIGAARSTVTATALAGVAPSSTMSPATGTAIVSASVG